MKLKKILSISLATLSIFTIHSYAQTYKSDTDDKKIIIRYDVNEKISSVYNTANLNLTQYINSSLDTSIKKISEQVSKLGYFEEEVEISNNIIKIDLDKKSNYKADKYIDSTERYNLINKLQNMLNTKPSLTSSDYVVNGGIKTVKPEAVLSHILKTLNIKESDITNLSKEYDDRQIEIEFTVDGIDFNFNANAFNGNITKAEFDYNQNIYNTTGNKISLEEAKNIALKNSGQKNVQFTKANLKDSVYTIEFKTSTNIYSYRIFANNGQILNFSVTPVNVTQNQTSLDKAKSSALKHAGLSTATFTKAEFDDGKYELEFYTDSAKYEYDVTLDGIIIDFEIEYKSQTPSQSTTIENAKNIALKHAGLSTATFTKAKFDDGKYEIEFYTNSAKYEYEVSLNGQVIDYEVEYYKAPSNSISLEKAKSIALNHAGISNPSYIKAEYDDGKYEVSFYYNNYEYEYEISSNGTIINFEKEYED